MMGLMIQPLIARTLESKSGGTPHEVAWWGNGEYTCTCIAGMNNKACWAVKQLKGEVELKKMHGELHEPTIELTESPAVYMRPLADLQHEQWAYIREQDAVRAEADGIRL